MLSADRDASKRAVPRHVKSTTYPYSPSLASSASSSTTSVFSNDEQSSQSSASSPPPSVKSAHENWDEDSVGASKSTVKAECDQGSLPSGVQWKSKRDAAQAPICHTPEPLPPAAAIIPELRVHPRRTQPSTHAEQSEGPRTARPPPALVRQCERKDNFVESLVDTTTQMIEVIWPLSAIPPSMVCREAVAMQAAGGRSLIDLRTFVQEVLKRSKTSYSTLQVALYYLVLVKSRIPRIDFTQEQPDDSHAARAMQCGRRMFLAALILASKYLQDRNYSARAWSKISGLRVNEINTNERAFLAAVEYQLHVPEPRFQRWTDVVLKYSLGSSPPVSPATRRCNPDPTASWRALVARLTPDLDDAAIAHPTTPTTPIDRFPFDVSASIRPRLPKAPRLAETNCFGDISNTTVLKPEALEPVVRSMSNSRDGVRFPPFSPRIPQLPTPQMTPRTNAFYTTPAASLPNPLIGSGAAATPGASMCGAMKQIQALNTARDTLDPFPNPFSKFTPFNAPLCRPRTLPNYQPARRSSLVPSLAASTISSPESMISDVSTAPTVSSRSSRSSSISSIASSGACAPPPCLARQAAHNRCAEFPPPAGRCAGQHWGDNLPLPRQYQYMTTDELLCLEGERPPPLVLGKAPESFVRGCPTPPSVSADPETEAALALGALASSGTEYVPKVPQYLPPRNRVRSGGMPKDLPHRKRERPCSTSDAKIDAREVVQHLVRQKLKQQMADNAAVWADQKVAKSVFLDSHDAREAVAEEERRPRTAVRVEEARQAPARGLSGSRDGQRKRVCCGQEVRTAAEWTKAEEAAIRSWAGESTLALRV